MDVRKAFVPRQIRGIHCAHHGFPQALTRGGNQDIGIASAIALVGCGDGVARPGFGRSLAGQPGGGRLVGNHTEGGVHQGGFQRMDRLAFPPGEQGSKHAHRNPLSAAQVDERGRAARWGRALVARHLHDASKGLHQRVIARHRPPGGTVAKGVQVVVQEIGVDGACGRLANANALRHTGSHTLNHHV